MQNVHRYFLYLALVIILILAYDVWKALWFVDPATGKNSFGIGVGTIVLAINVYLLSGYTFGCHSLRHLIGGFRDQLQGRQPVIAPTPAWVVQPSPYAMGMDKSVLGRFHRSIRAALCHGVSGQIGDYLSLEGWRTSGLLLCHAERSETSLTIGLR